MSFPAAMPSVLAPPWRLQRVHPPDTDFLRSPDSGGKIGQTGLFDLARDLNWSFMHITEAEV
jgi:hypothetical protein